MPGDQQRAPVFRQILSARDLDATEENPQQSTAIPEEDPVGTGHRDES
jgi:hypothetical protein